MHCGDKSYSIYNDKVYSVIFYSDNFLSHQKHFHFKGTKTNLSAFGNSDEIRVFLSKKCKTNIDFQTTSKKKYLVFSKNSTFSTFEFFYVGCLYKWQICQSNHNEYSHFVTLGTKPKPKYLESVK